MFFCRRNPLLTLLLMALGLRVLKKERWSEEDKSAYRAKRRAFRHKLREAFDVWDDGANDGGTEGASNGTSTQGS